MLKLEGVNSKIIRARKCLERLETDMTAFCEYERRRKIFEIESRVPVIVSDNMPETPIDYSTRVGEIAYTLRSALDHLVWQLVIYNGREPSTRNQFPICSREERYVADVKHKLKGLKQQHIDAIRCFQPFQEGSAVGSHLRMLNSICNIDKHRHLNVVALHASSSAYLKEGTDPDLTYPITGGLALVDMLKDTEHEDKLNIEVITDICFMDEELKAASVGYGSAIEGTGVQRPPVAPVLRGCLIAVQFVVDRFNSGFMTGKWTETTR